jgi:hypothetical protein
MTAAEDLGVLLGDAPTSEQRKIQDCAHGALVL